MKKPKLELNKNGNAFAILVRAKHAARKAEWSEKKIQKFRKKAMSGDHDNLLQVCNKYFDVQQKEKT